MEVAPTPRIFPPSAQLKSSSLCITLFLTTDIRFAIATFDYASCLRPQAYNTTQPKQQYYTSSTIVDMRVAAILLAGLSALAAAQTTAPDATEVAHSMAVAASIAASIQASKAASIISAERAGQTLSGEAHSQAVHNSAVLASALSAQTAEKSTIAAAEKSVLSEASKAKHSLSQELATATGELRLWNLWGRDVLIA